MTLAVTTTTAGGTAAALVLEAAAVVTALLILAGVLWRVVRPHVRAFVSEQTAAARQLQPDGSAFDRLDRLVVEVGGARADVAGVRAALDEHHARLGKLETRLDDHLRHAAGELTMLRAVVAATGIDLVPRDNSAPRRRWYDHPDPDVPSYEARRVRT